MPEEGGLGGLIKDKGGSAMWLGRGRDGDDEGTGGWRMTIRGIKGKGAGATRKQERGQQRRVVLCN